MEVRYSPRFKRSYQSLPPHIQESFDEQLVIFMQNSRDPRLGAHKLKGRLEECLAFMLRDGYRVLFEYARADAVNLLDVGPHDYYRRWQN